MARIKTPDFTHTPSLGRPLLAAGLLGFTVGALATPWLLEDEENLFFVGISLVVLTIIFAWWVSLSQDQGWRALTHRPWNQLAALGALKPPRLSLPLLAALFCAGGIAGITGKILLLANS